MSCAQFNRFVFCYSVSLGVVVGLLCCVHGFFFFCNLNSVQKGLLVNIMDVPKWCKWLGNNRVDPSLPLTTLRSCQ